MLYDKRYPILVLSVIGSTTTRPRHNLSTQKYFTYFRGLSSDPFYLDSSYSTIMSVIVSQFLCFTLLKSTKQRKEKIEKVSYDSM